MINNDLTYDFGTILHEKCIHESQKMYTRIFYLENLNCQLIEMRFVSSSTTNRREKPKLRQMMIRT